VSGDDARLRGLLEEERSHLLQRIDELTIGGEVELDFDADFADRGSVASAQGENYTLADTLQSQLTAVEKALVRIEDGTYGTCDVCGEQIGQARLEAIPATSRCINHATAP
jgi:DnaK suppressor protein